jgi:hypothetical protein
MTDAQKTRRRRVARRIVLAIAVPVVLLSGYVGSYFAFTAGRNAGSLSNYVWPIYERIGWVWLPVYEYERSDLPFSVELLAVDAWCWSQGTIEWSEARQIAVKARTESLSW